VRRRNRKAEQARQAELRQAAAKQAEARQAEARQAGIEAGGALARCHHAYLQAVARAQRAEQALLVLLGWIERYPKRWTSPRTLPPPLPASVAAAEAQRARRIVELRAEADHADLQRERAEAQTRHEREEAATARRAAVDARRVARARATAHEAEVADFARQRATLARMVMASLRAGGLIPTAKQLQIVSDLSGLSEAELRRVTPEGDRRAG
jgi:hypothetical protein